MLGMLARILQIKEPYFRISHLMQPPPLKHTIESSPGGFSLSDKGIKIVSLMLFSSLTLVVFLHSTVLGIFELPADISAIAVSHAMAEDRRHSPEYDSLKARYNKIRNTDPAIEREVDWEKLILDFERHAGVSTAPQDRSASLYHAALLCAELAVVRKDDGSARRAANLLEQIVSDSPNGPFADDALLKLGELQKTRGEADAARGTFEKLQRDYPKSELSAVAAARVIELDGRGRLEKKNKGSVLADSKGPVIVIDPGHGGEDLGAKGVGGLLEKDVTMSVARELADILRSKHGATVKLTRVDDVFVPLADRTAFANDLEADVFISLHANASPTGKLNGLETFILDNADDKATKLLAERENASIQFEGQDADLQFMLSDLLQSSKLNESKQLAENIQLEILKTLDSNFTRPKDLGVKKAPFYVLVGAHMPSVLVEMGFIDNVQEGRSLAEKGFRRAIAEGIAKGLSNYLKATGKG